MKSRSETFRKSLLVSTHEVVYILVLNIPISVISNLLILGMYKPQFMNLLSTESR